MMRRRQSKYWIYTLYILEPHKLATDNGYFALAPVNDQSVALLGCTIPPMSGLSVWTDDEFKKWTIFLSAHVTGIVYVNT
jgi:hypothetical protein